MSAFLPRVLAPSLVWAVLLLTAPAAPGQTFVERVYVPTSSTILLDSTSYYTPTSSVYYMPTSAVYATTAVVRPTSYYVPTTYVATSSSILSSSSTLVPTGYLVTRSSLFGLRQTSYFVPTSTSILTSTRYVLPTTTTLSLPVISTSAVSTASSCCGSATVATYDSPIVSDRVVGADSVIREEEYVDNGSSSSVESAPPATAPAPSGNGTSSGEPRLNPNVLRSEPTNGNGTSQPAATPPPAQESAPMPPAREPEPAPAPPAEEVVPPPVTPGQLPPPVDPAPADLPGNLPAAPPLVEPGSTSSVPDHQEAMRPAFRDEQIRRAGMARSTLTGKVVSAVSGQPESGVPVVVSDSLQRFRDRMVTTDAEGSFSVVLPEGDWTVKVPKVSGGGVQIERPITVGGGLITDDQNREVTSLTINR